MRAAFFKYFPLASGFLDTMSVTIKVFGTLQHMILYMLRGFAVVECNKSDRVCRFAYVSKAIRSRVLQDMSFHRWPLTLILAQ